MTFLLPDTPLSLWYNVLAAIELCFAAGVLTGVLTNRMTLIFVSGFNVMLPVVGVYAWYSPLGLNTRLIVGVICMIVYLARLNIVITVWSSNTSISKLSNTLPSAEKLIASAVLTHVCGLAYCLPFYYLALDTDLARVSFGSDARDYCAVGAYTVGTVFHFLGDYQKRVFKQRAENKGKLLTSGVWSVSRHPNYFGDFLVYASFAVLVYQHPLAWASPALNLLQYLFDAIPKNEQWAAEKYGRHWQIYVSNTPMLVPFPYFRK